MVAQLKSHELWQLAIAVLVIGAGLYFLFLVIDFVSSNIGSILAIAAIGLVGSIVWFYYSSSKAT